MFQYVAIAALALSLSSASSDEYHTRGWIEHARVMPNGLLMTAKLDSGARTTSIHAEILSTSNGDDADSDSADAGQDDDGEADAMKSFGDRMGGGQPPDDPAEDIADIEDGVMSEFMPDTIKFRLTSRGGRELVLTKPVVRWVSIRRRGGGSIVRPVVELDLCVAGRRVSGEVNLADRTGFNYPLLIGRNMLSDAAISIDSREIFQAPKACPKDEDA